MSGTGMQQRLQKRGENPLKKTEKNKASIMILCINQPSGNQVKKGKSKMKNIIIATLLTLTVTTTNAQAIELTPSQQVKLEAVLTAASAGGLIGFIAGGWRGALTTATLSGGLTFVFNYGR